MCFIKNAFKCNTNIDKTQVKMAYRDRFYMDYFVLSSFKIKKYTFLRNKQIFAVQLHSPNSKPVSALSFMTASYHL